MSLCGGSVIIWPNAVISYRGAGDSGGEIWARTGVFSENRISVQITLDPCLDLKQVTPQTLCPKCQTLWSNLVTIWHYCRNIHINFHCQIQFSLVVLKLCHLVLKINCRSAVTSWQLLLLWYIWKIMEKYSKRDILRMLWLKI